MKKNQNDPENKKNSDENFKTIKQLNDDLDKRYELIRKSKPIFNEVVVGLDTPSTPINLRKKPDTIKTKFKGYELNELRTNPQGDKADACSQKSAFSIYEGEAYEDILQEGYEDMGDKQMRPEGGGLAFNFKLELGMGDKIKQLNLNQNEYKLYDDYRVKVAVVDGGIEFNQSPPLKVPEAHREETGFLSGFPGCNPEDDMNYHGTIVAKIITSNLTGNLQNLKLLDLRIFNKESEGDFLDALRAIDYAICKDVDIINLSWGFYSKTFNSILLKLFMRAREEGIIIVTSAGNKGTNTDIFEHYPSGFDLHNFREYTDNVVSVAYLGKDNHDKVSINSNYGAISVSLASHGHIFKSIEGTSYAAAQVTRRAAIYKNQDPQLTYQEIIQQLMLTDPIITPPMVFTKGKMKQ